MIVGCFAFILIQVLLTLGFLLFSPLVPEPSSASVAKGASSFSAPSVVRGRYRQHSRESDHPKVALDQRETNESPRRASSP